MQKVMISLEMTDRVMSFHPSREQGPADVTSKRWEEKEETFSNPHASAWQVGFEGFLSCMRSCPCRSAADAHPMAAACT